MELRLDERVVLVTGAGRGIGRAIAEKLAGAGAAVAVATRTADSGEQTVEAIRAVGHKAELYVVDVGEREQVSRLVADVAARFGRLDVVVHNAAHQPYMPIEQLVEADLDRIIDVNLKAAFWLLVDSLPQLRASPAPRFLVTTSITGTDVANFGYTAYGASKAGLIGFIRQAGGELAALGVRVNGVSPGNTMTDATRSHIALTRDDLSAGIPLGTLADAEDIANAMLFLASDAASHMTGQTITVDGGQGLGFS